MQKLKNIDKNFVKFQEKTCCINFNVIYWLISTVKPVLTKKSKYNLLYKMNNS